MSELSLHGVPFVVTSLHDFTGIQFIFDEPQSTST